jgi:hypothetical protein
MPPQTTPYLLLCNSDGAFRVLLGEIIYCASFNSCSIFNLSNNRKIVVTTCSISEYEKVLELYGFVRIHQSTLLNTTYLSCICKGNKSNSILLTTGEELQLSRDRRAEVIKTLKDMSVEQKCVQQEFQNNGLIVPNSQKTLRDSRKQKTATGK